jgi:hypothetical protein
MGTVRLAFAWGLLAAVVGAAGPPGPSHAAVGRPSGSVLPRGWEEPEPDPLLAALVTSGYRLLDRLAPRDTQSQSQSPAPAVLALRRVPCASAALFAAAGWPVTAGIGPVSGRSSEDGLGSASAAAAVAVVGLDGSVAAGGGSSAAVASTQRRVQWVQVDLPVLVRGAWWVWGAAAGGRGWGHRRGRQGCECASPGRYPSPLAPCATTWAGEVNSRASGRSGTAVARQQSTVRQPCVRRVVDARGTWGQGCGRRRDFALPIGMSCTPPRPPPPPPSLHPRVLLGQSLLNKCCCAAAVNARPAPPPHPAL